MCTWSPRESGQLTQLWLGLLASGSGFLPGVELPRTAPRKVDTSQTQNPGAPSTQMVPTLGPNVYKHDLLWAIWISRGSLGKLAMGS